MSHFDEETNGTFLHSWRSHEGNPDENVYFPSSTFGVDANRTFEYVGLVVFSDVAVPRRPGFCNATLGFVECLGGGCFHLETKCNGRFDCQDGTDESDCKLSSTSQYYTLRNCFNEWPIFNIQKTISHFFCRSIFQRNRFDCIQKVEI